MNWMEVAKHVFHPSNLNRFKTIRKLHKSFSFSSELLAELILAVSIRPEVK